MSESAIRFPKQGKKPKKASELKRTAITKKEPKPKKCGSPHCEELFKPIRTGQKTCYNFKCAIDYADHVEAKKAKKQNAAEKKAFNLGDRPKQFKLTKAAIQKWVNHVRDNDMPCISCGTTNDVVYCGGHYKTAGGNPERALWTPNIHRQCNFHCNSSLSGNIEGTKHSKGYKKGLVERYGADYLESLEVYREFKSLTGEDLMEIRKSYFELIRENNKDDSNLQKILLM